MGRPVGSKNMNRRGMLARLQREFGKDYNPILEMARIATAKDEDGNYIHDDDKRFAMNKDIAPYTVPRLKHVEMSSDDGPLTVQVVQFANVRNNDTE